MTKRHVPETARTLADTAAWTEAVYADLMSVRAGTMSTAAFDDKYLVRQTIVVLDFTGFTETVLRGGALESFLRILDGQRLCIPILREQGATFIHTFADDVVALFDHPAQAIEASLQIVDESREARERDPGAAECCIGIGYGDVYAIGPNHAMGDEMNRASKLGEDTARGGEILVTEQVRGEIDGEPGIELEQQVSDDLLFPYYRVTRSR